MVEVETALDATVKSDGGTGPPEIIGEIAAVRQEKENGVKEVEKEVKEEGRTDTLKVEEENGVKEEREGESVKKEEVDKKMEEEGDAKEGKEKEEAKEEVGDADMVEESNVEEKESEEEAKEDAGLAKLDEEAKEDAGSGKVDEEVKESTGTANVNDEVKEDAGDAQTEEGGDLKGDDKHGKVEEKTEASLEVKGMNKRRRGQRGEGKRRVVKAEKGEMKEEEAEEEKGSTEKKEADEEKGTTEKKVSEEKVVAKKEKRDEEKGDATKKYGDRQRRKAMKVEVDGEKRVVKDVDMKKRKELSSPVAFSPDRPVRERKSVNRLVATIENEPVKEFVIQKGQGTPLKDIPNVAYKLAKKRNEENLKLLHTVIYGRKAKASHVKSNISQFSGFVWPDNEEKQHAKIKERLDKFVKNKLIEFCDVLDIPIAKATARKEDLVSKIMDFLISPHATTDILLAEKDQPKKRKRTVDRITPKKLGSTSAKRSARKRRKIGDNPKVNEKSTLETEDEEVEGQENDNGVPHVSENEASEHSESEKEKDESEGEDDEDSGQRKPSSKKSLKRSSAQTVNAKKARTPKKILQPTPTKSSMITSFNQSKSIGDSDTIPKVFSRKKKNDETPKKKSSVPSKSASRARTGKKVGNEKEKHKKESGPSEDELRKTICDILKEADFNTATFTDILKQLARHFKTDLTTRKSAIKLMIHEELTKLADEAEDDDDEGDEDNEENPDPAEVKA